VPQTSGRPKPKRLARGDVECPSAALRVQRNLPYLVVRILLLLVRFREWFSTSATREPPSEAVTSRTCRSGSNRWRDHGPGVHFARCTPRFSSVLTGRRTRGRGVTEPLRG